MPKITKETSLLEPEKTVSHHNLGAFSQVLISEGDCHGQRPVLSSQVMRDEAASVTLFHRPVCIPVGGKTVLWASTMSCAMPSARCTNGKGT